MPAQTTIQKKSNRKKETMTPTCWCKYLHNQACPFSQTLSDGVGGGLWGRGETSSPLKCCIYLQKQAARAHGPVRMSNARADSYTNCVFCIGYLLKLHR